MAARFLRRLGLMLAVDALPALALAQTPALTDFRSLANFITMVIDAIIPILIGLGVLYYFGGMVNVLRQKDSSEEWTRLRVQAGWGIFALFVMLFVWAIVRVLGNTLFGTSALVPLA